MDRIALVARFVVDEFLPDVPVGDLHPDDDLQADGIVDSLGVLRIIAWLQDEFGLDPDTIELDPEAFRSVRTITALLERHVPAGAG